METVTDTFKVTFKDVTKSMTKVSKEGYKSIADLNRKVSELVKVRAIGTCCLVSASNNLIKPENRCQFKLLKGPNSNRVNILLIKKTRPVTLYDNLLSFRDSKKEV